MISQGVELRIRQIEKELAASLAKLEPSANEQHIKKLIRDKALQIYNLGIDYTSDYFGVEPFIAAEDFAPIGRIVDDTYRIYHYQKDMSSALITLTSVTLAKAIRSKALQIRLLQGAAPTKHPHMKQIEVRLPAPEIPTGVRPTKLPHMKQIELQLPIKGEVPVPSVVPRMKTVEAELPKGVAIFEQPILKVLVTWRTQQDDRVCPICLPLEGQEWELDDPDMLTPVIDTHPNCLTPNTIVQAPGIVSALRTLYNGPIIELVMQSGVKLSVTPNHMILTPQGFAAADFLREGDYVITSSASNSYNVIGQPDYHGRPSSIEQVFNSLCKSGCMSTVSMPLAAEDLHGDAAFCKCNVDIVRTTSFLQDRIHTIFPKFSMKSEFIGGGKSQSIILDSQSMFDSLLHRLAFASDGRMSSSRKTSPFFRGRLRHTQIHGFTSSPLNNSHSSQSYNYGVSANTKMLAKLLDRHSSIIQLDQIVQINVVSSQWPIFVYDLQTLPTVYVGNGIILSNCRCRLELNTEDTTAAEMAAFALGD